MHVFALFKILVIMSVFHLHLSAQHQVLGIFDLKEGEVMICDDAIPSKKEL